MNFKKEILKAQRYNYIPSKIWNIHVNLIEQFLIAEVPENIIYQTLKDKITDRQIEKLIYLHKERVAFNNRKAELGVITKQLPPDLKAEIQKIDRKKNKDKHYAAFVKSKGRSKGQTLRRKKEKAIMDEIKAETALMMSSVKPRKPKKKKPFWK